MVPHASGVMIVVAHGFLSDASVCVIDITLGPGAVALTDQMRLACSARTVCVCGGLIIGCHACYAAKVVIIGDKTTHLWFLF